MNFNLVVLAGNLTRDVELRYTPKGTAVAVVGIAMNRKWKDESGAQKEEVTFQDIEAWGRTAENLGQYCKKGSNIHIEGHLKTNSWTDKQSGQKRSKNIVVIDSMQFVGSPDGSRSAQSQPAPAPAPAPRPAANPPTTTPATDAPSDAGDDDVPFMSILGWLNGGWKFAVKAYENVFQVRRSETAG